MFRYFNFMRVKKVLRFQITECKNFINIEIFSFWGNHLKRFVESIQFILSHFNDRANMNGVFGGKVAKCFVNIIPKWAFNFGCKRWFINGFLLVYGGWVLFFLLIPPPFSIILTGWSPLLFFWITNSHQLSIYYNYLSLFIQYHYYRL